MLSFPGSLRIFLAAEPTNMNKSFDGLVGLVEGVLEEDPYSGALFVFRNRRGDKAKLLLWERSGFWIYYKRLELGKFRWPEISGGKAKIEATDLALLLEGIELAGAHRRRCWKPPVRI